MRTCIGCSVCDGSIPQDKGPKHQDIADCVRELKDKIAFLEYELAYVKGKVQSRGKQP